jgi:hypothetical protein
MFEIHLNVKGGKGSVDQIEKTKHQSELLGGCKAIRFL